jgi:hypothetical protein
MAKRKPVGPQDAGNVHVESVCPYNGWRGEYRNGNIYVMTNFKGDDELGLVVCYDNEDRCSEGEDEDNKWETVADVVMTRDEARQLAETILRAIG